MLREDGTLWLLCADKYLPDALTQRGWMPRRVDWATPLRVDPAGRARLHLFVKQPRYYYNTHAAELFLAPRTRTAFACATGRRHGCAWSPEHRRELMRLCILAGSSRTSCRVCGAPYTRTPRGGRRASCTARPSRRPLPGSRSLLPPRRRRPARSLIAAAGCSSGSRRVSGDDRLAHSAARPADRRARATRGARGDRRRTDRRDGAARAHTPGRTRRHRACGEHHHDRDYAIESARTGNVLSRPSLAGSGSRRVVRSSRATSPTPTGSAPASRITDATRSLIVSLRAHPPRVPPGYARRAGRASSNCTRHRHLSGQLGVSAVVNDGGLIDYTVGLTLASQDRRLLVTGVEQD